MAKKKDHYKMKLDKKLGVNVFDTKLDQQYAEIISDIEDLQYEIYKADKKKKKKKKKQLKAGLLPFYEGSCTKSKKARIKAAKKLTSEDFFVLIRNLLTDLKPVVIILARLIAMLITAILSLDIVKERIGKESLKKMDSLYKLCLQVS